MPYAIAFKNRKTGKVLYYTGESGDTWLSPNRDEAFFGYSLDGADMIGGRMLRRHCLTLSNHELLAVPSNPPARNAWLSDDTEGGNCD